MPRFVFRLDPLLRARRETERRHQRAVAELERRRRDLEDDLRRRQGFIAEGKRELSERLTGRLDLGALRDHAGASLRMLREANRIVVELAGVHTRLEEARATLVEATRARRALELLRERRFDAWKRDLDKREDAALDEIAGRPSARSETMP